MISVGSDGTLDKGEDHESSYAHNRQFPGAGGGAVDVAHTSVTSPAHTRRLRHRPGGSSVSALSEDQARSVGGNGFGGDGHHLGDLCLVVGHISFKWCCVSNGLNRPGTTLGRIPVWPPTGSAVGPP